MRDRPVGFEAGRPEGVGELDGGQGDGGVGVVRSPAPAAGHERPQRPCADRQKYQPPVSEHVIRLLFDSLREFHFITFP